MFMHDNGLTFITNFMINCYRCVADAMAEQARLTQPSPIQIWLTYAPGLFGLLPDRAWIWLDFPTFEHDDLRKFTGLTCVLPAMVRRPVISRWLIPRDWSLFSENIKSFYFISFINPLYSYFVLNWLKKHEICYYDSDINGKFLSFSYFIGYILNSLVQNQFWLPKLVTFGHRPPKLVANISS